MVSISDIEWGPIDALTRDNTFADKWVEPNTVQACLEEDRWLISGEKGSGKSAIRVAIRDLNKGGFNVAAEIDFKEVSFSAVHHNLIEIAKTTQLESLPIMSRAWQYVIISEMITACVQKYRNIYKPVLNRLPSLGSSTERLQTANQRLTSVLEDLWNQLDEFTGTLENDSGSGNSANLLNSGGLTAALLERLRRFPIDDAFMNIVDEFFSKISSHSHRVVLIMDGLDQLSVDTNNRDALNQVFAGLSDAVLRIRGYRNLPAGLQLKVIIPHDRYLSLPLVDFDKLPEIHSALRWRKEDLEEFVRRRIEMKIGPQSGSFATVWKLILPEEVTNSRTGMAENTFEYVLRHTMYRPRHLQLHLLNLSKRNKVERLDARAVVRTVADTARSISEYWVHEYDIDFKGLNSLLHHFVRKPNILTYGEFRERIVTFCRRQGIVSDGQSIDWVVNALFQMGFFGVLRTVDHSEIRPTEYFPPSRSGQRHLVDFYYKNSRPSVANRMTDDTEVAIHAIFNEDLELNTSRDLVIG